MVFNTALIIISILVSGAILLIEDWRLRLAIVTITQLIAFILIVQIWPVALASVKLISGWMGISLLAMTLFYSSTPVQQKPPDSAKLYRILLGTFGWIIVFASVQPLNEWLPISYTHLFIGLVFFINGLILLGFSQSVLDTVLGLLVFFAGFDIIYSSLEGSALITGIFGVIIVSICLTGSYLEGGFNFGGSE